MACRASCLSESPQAVETEEPDLDFGETLLLAAIMRRESSRCRPIGAGVGTPSRSHPMTRRHDAPLGGRRRRRSLPTKGRFTVLRSCEIRWMAVPLLIIRNMEYSMLDIIRNKRIPESGTYYLLSINHDFLIFRNLWFLRVSTNKYLRNTARASPSP